MTAVYICPIEHSPNANDPVTGELIITANLSAADDSVSAVAAGIEIHDGIERRIVLPRTANVSTKIAARPAKDRRGRWRRPSLLDRLIEIGRKGKTAGRKAESGPGNTGYELVAHWPDPPILTLI